MNQICHAKRMRGLHAGWRRDLMNWSVGPIPWLGAICHDRSHASHDNAMHPPIFFMAMGNKHTPTHLPSFLLQISELTHLCLIWRVARSSSRRILFIFSLHAKLLCVLENELTCWSTSGRMSNRLGDTTCLLLPMRILDTYGPVAHCNFKCSLCYY